MKLVIPHEVEQKIHAYVMSTKGEIAGMGKVRAEKYAIYVEDVMIYEQDATAATADLSPQAIAKWQTELVKAGGSPKDWRLWWHSHADMEAFFSKRDTDTIDTSDEADWMCSLVVNKRKQREARLDTYRPFRMKIEDMDIEIDGEPSFTVPAEIAAEVAEKVKAPPARMGYGGSGTGYNGVKDGLQDTIDLHRYCPRFFSNGKQYRCSRPYGKDAQGVYADCTDPLFNGMYGKQIRKMQLQNDDDETAAERSADDDAPREYSSAEILGFTKELHGDLKALESQGRGHSDEANETRQELADWYYQLAEMEMDENLAEQIRAEAAYLEDEVYQTYA